MNGRLTPGVTVNFSNGDRLTTDATGRALFVAPLNPGVIYGSIAGRTGRVATAIRAPGEAASTSIEVSSAPQFASLIDRFELFGKSFCGDADANEVTIAKQPAIVLAASPTALVVFPPPGPASRQSGGGSLLRETPVAAFFHHPCRARTRSQLLAIETGRASCAHGAWDEGEDRA
jgi:hypothetical protein